MTHQMRTIFVLPLLSTLVLASLLAACAAGSRSDPDGGVRPDAGAADAGHSDGGREVDAGGRTCGQLCYEGPADTRDVGACREGTWECAPDRQPVCRDAVVPTEETCDGGMDEDCDGRVDEGCAPPPRNLQTGDDHGCLRRADGTLECWGYAFFGQLGEPVSTVCQDDLTCRPRAAPLDAPTGVVELSAGGMTTCARTDIGQAFCWGRQSAGELPISAPDLCERTFPANSWACAQTPQRAPSLDGATRIVIEENHGCAIFGEGELRCWGSDHYGESAGLFDGWCSTNLARGDSVECVTAPTPVPGMTDVVEVAVGIASTCARRRDGTVWCWGKNAMRQLGRETTETCFDGSQERPCDATPAPVPGLDDVVELAMAPAQTVCARRASGEVLCWGYAGAGVTGPPPYDDCDGFPCRHTPHPIEGLGEVTQLALGYGFGCALDAGGAVRCWGAEDSGQLGVEPDGEPARGATQVPLPEPALEISAGWGFACARTTEDVYCWGRNRRGQLAAPLTDYRAAPAPIER